MQPEPPDSREPYGRLVHGTRLACEAVRAAAEGRRQFRLGTWEERAGWQQETDMAIGSAVAARAVHDAGLDLDAARMEIARLRARLAECEAAMEALGGEDGHGT